MRISDYLLFQPGIFTGDGSYTIVFPKQERQGSRTELIKGLRRFQTKPSVKGNFSKDGFEKDLSILYRLSTKTNQRRMGCRSIFTIHSMSADFNRRA